MAPPQMTLNLAIRPAPGPWRPSRRPKSSSTAHSGSSEPPETALAALSLPPDVVGPSHGFLQVRGCHRQRLLSAARTDHFYYTFVIMLTAQGSMFAIVAAHSVQVYTLLYAEGTPLELHSLQPWQS